MQRVSSCVVFLPNVSSAGSLRAGQRVERKVRIGVKESHRRKERARRLASRALVERMRSAQRFAAGVGFGEFERCTCLVEDKGARCG